MLQKESSLCFLVLLNVTEASLHKLYHDCLGQTEFCSSDKVILVICELRRILEENRQQSMDQLAPSFGIYLFGLEGKAFYLGS